LSFIKEVLLLVDADLCIFDDNIEIKAVIVGGNLTVNKF